MAESQLNDNIKAIASSLCSHDIDDIIHAKGGFNNRVFKVICGGKVFALKSYPQQKEDLRNRLLNEYRTLKFFEGNDLVSVPKVFAIDSVNSYALMEWIEGEPVCEVSEQDIDFALNFIGKIYNLKDAEGADEMQDASEACLSGTEIVKQISKRLDRLINITQESESLYQYLTKEFIPVFTDIQSWSMKNYQLNGFDFYKPIPWEMRGLIPADFGFHNALRSANSKITFLDFEYFGWDDPVKLTADFLLHPGMNLSHSLYSQFCKGMVNFMRNDKMYQHRLISLYPLFGLRWCLILLNEFLPERWQRRIYAGAHTDRKNAELRQLELSRQLLNVIINNYRNLPYVQ